MIWSLMPRFVASEAVLISRQFLTADGSGGAILTFMDHADNESVCPDYLIQTGAPTTTKTKKSKSAHLNALMPYLRVHSSNAKGGSELVETPAGAVA